MKKYIAIYLHNSNRYFKIVFFIIFFIMFSLVMAKVWPLGADYYYHFYPLAKQWLNGQFTIYDGTGEILFYPPWSLFIIVPLGILPIEISHGFLFVISLILIGFSIRLFHDKNKLSLIPILFAFINLYTFDLLIRGQLDAIILFGIVLGFWALRHRKPFWLSIGICLSVMKPPLNVSLILLLYFISIRQWPRRYVIIVFLSPIIMVLVSSLMVGLDWPVTFLSNLQPPIEYLSISIWKSAGKILPFWLLFIITLLAVGNFLRLSWKHGATVPNLSLALTTNLVFTPYANGDHYILLIPAFLFVFQNKIHLGVLVYILSWTPLIRLFWGYEASSFDILFPVTILIFSYLFYEGHISSSVDT